MVATRVVLLSTYRTQCPPETKLADVVITQMNKDLLHLSARSNGGYEAHTIGRRVPLGTPMTE